MKIVTHDSGFHTDDVFAVATILLVVGEGEVIRSRDPQVHKTADYLVDTGDEYNSSLNYFEHHKPGGAGMRDNNIPYASFGLVWKEFGEKLAGGEREAKIIDARLAQPIDAHDNGVAVSEYKFSGIREYTIGDFFDSFNNSLIQSQINSVFMQVVSIAKDLLAREILIARKNVLDEDRLLSLYNESRDKRVIIMTENFDNWRGILATTTEAIFGIYQGPDSKWRIKGVPDLSKPYYGPVRKPLPKEWAGKRDEELQKLTGVEDAVFAHRSGFMAAARTKEGALRLAEIALNA